MSLVAGVDVGSARLHVVVLDDSAQLVATRMWATSEIAAAAESLASCDVVAIDSPDRWSAGLLPEHAGLSPKFVGARCAEFELARKHRIWVPWVTPPEPTPEVIASGRFEWMRRGIELFAELDGRAETIEVYPFAIYRWLARPDAIPRKNTIEGVKRRIELMRERGITERDLEMWSHDGLDALAAAVVALDRYRGTAVEVTCGHDGSAMWQPETVEGGPDRG